MSTNKKEDIRIEHFDPLPKRDDSSKKTNRLMTP